MSAPSVAWRPDAGCLRDSNLARFMAAESVADFDALVARSINEPDWFWDAIVRTLKLHFDEPYQQVLDTSAGIPWAKWFVGGRLNIASTCIDARANNDLALIWEGEEGTTRELTGAQLRALTDRIAAGLAARGVKEGDAVGLFLPMIPETVAAVFAVAKLGAVFLPIFSGYGAEAVAIRLEDASAVAVVTADGFTRRGKAIGMKEIADAAVAQVPTVHTVLVVPRLGRSDVPMTPGRDVVLDDFPDASFDALSVDSEHPLFIAYTSGTTGKPKGAVHVHGGFLAKIAL
jgi:acetyl-CoA synthetase